MTRLVVPPIGCGVYALIDGEKVVWVGQSGKVSRRLHEHWNAGRIFDAVEVYLCRRQDLTFLELFITMQEIPRRGALRLRPNEERFWGGICNWFRPEIRMRPLPKKFVGTKKVPT